MLKETDFKSYSFVQKEKIDELNGYGYVLEHKCHKRPDQTDQKP